VAYFLQTTSAADKDLATLPRGVLLCVEHPVEGTAVKGPLPALAADPEKPPG
jgi:hypothetical protein